MILIFNFFDRIYRIVRILKKNLYHREHRVSQRRTKVESKDMFTAESTKCRREGQLWVSCALKKTRTCSPQRAQSVAEKDKYGSAALTKARAKD
jgi:hypothetical protein